MNPKIYALFRQKQSILFSRWRLPRRIVTFC